MLDGGQLRKYAIYAAGEILLVVVGILLALQVNNWNENKKQTRSEAVYLNRLSEDISDMMVFYQREKEIVASINGAHQALDYLESCGEKEGLETAFRQTLLTHQVLGNFLQNRSTYDEMVSSGAFARLKNTELKDVISKMFNWVEGGNLNVSYFREELGRASAIINERVSFSYDPENKLIVDYQIPEICGDKQFRNALVEVIDSRQDVFFIFKNIHRSLQQALALLEKEQDG